ncbi:MAG: biopolymer transporter ExbD [Crocinitomicaceae bacterium]|nr:biopolymer transporter ExbD [Crocinitomicaceae bacterium]
MAIRRNKRFEIEIAREALSDIMFFLLLFFLIISTLANPNVIKMDLPKADAPEKTSQKHLTLSVTKDEGFFVDKEPVAFEDIESVLLAKTTELGNNTVVVRIAYDMEVQRLIDVLQIGTKNDLKFVIAADITK